MDRRSYSVLSARLKQPILSILGSCRYQTHYSNAPVYSMSAWHEPPKRLKIHSAVALKITLLLKLGE